MFVFLDSKRTEPCVRKSCEVTFMLRVLIRTIGTLVHLQGKAQQVKRIMSANHTKIIFSLFTVLCTVYPYPTTYV